MKCEFGCGTELDIVGTSGPVEANTAPDVLEVHTDTCCKRALRAKLDAAEERERALREALRRCLVSGDAGWRAVDGYDLQRDEWLEASDMGHAALTTTERDK